MEKFDLEHFPVSESALKMLDSVSEGFYDKSYVGKWIFQVMGMEYDGALKAVEELPAQLFPETATWGLVYHEIKWGLPVREDLPYEERRRLVCRKRDYRAPMTPYRMEKCLEEVSGFEVHIADAVDLGEYGFIPPHPNVFKVYFLGEGTLDAAKVRRMLNELKQSHTVYRINERTELDLDNRELEQILLKDIHFVIGVPFWGGVVLDDTWLMDGSVLLNSVRRYGLAVRLFFETFGISHGALWKKVFRIVSAAGSIQHTMQAAALIKQHLRVGYLKARGLDVPGQVLFVKYACKTADDPGEVRHRVFGVGWKQHTHGNVAVGAVYQMEGMWAGKEVHKTAASLAVHTKATVQGPQTADQVTVETKTPGYWFMDGSVPMDGTRSLNSVYRKEVAQ